jgi:hypothetical protein
MDRSVEATGGGSGQESVDYQQTRGYDGVPTRTICIPVELQMSLAEGLRAVGGHTEDELAQIEAEHPGPAGVDIYIFRRGDWS